jgi:hypothetical protein
MEITLGVQLPAGILETMRSTPFSQAIMPMRGEFFLKSFIAAYSWA